jgi:hypothetical protein
MSSFLKRWAEEPEKHESESYAVEQASALLNSIVARILRLHNSLIIGVRRECDGQEIRSALAALHMHELPVRYLDEDVLPESYKTRTK